MASGDTIAVRVSRAAPHAAAAAQRGDELELAIPTDAIRAEATLAARLERPAIARDALLALGDVLLSDLRFKTRDRADYLKYLAASGKKVTQAVWDAQKAFLDAQYGEAVHTESPLPPILTIDDDTLAIEAFSRDESAYARLHFDRAKTFTAERATRGTTYLDLTQELLRSIGRIRSYRTTSLRLQPPAHEHGTGSEETAIHVPYRWLRAFGLVQAASTLPSEVFEIAPVDLYNVLFTLRMKRAKKPPRALRYELVPGERPRLVIEPWELLIEATSGPYRGTRPQVVRTFGRNRLNTLARLLPHAKKIAIHLVGAGLPAFYVVHLHEGTFTLALSGWTESGWSGAASFDLLTPDRVDPALVDQIHAELHSAPKTLDQLVLATRQPKTVVRHGVLRLMQRGLVVHHLATGTVRHRSLLGQPIDVEKIKYGNKAEEHAHRLLENAEAVRLVRVHELGAEGTAIDGEVNDQRAHRVYKTSFTIDREGRAANASCTCPPFRRAGMREGPCEHMIALRLKHAREKAALEEARGTEEGRKLIRAETRTLIRRDKHALTTYQLSLDDRRVTIRLTQGKSEPRMQRLFFGSAESARSEYFSRLSELASRQFIDADAP